MQLHLHSSNREATAILVQFNHDSISLFQQPLL